MPLTHSWSWKYQVRTHRSMQGAPHSKKFAGLYRFRGPAYWQRQADLSSIGQDQAKAGIVHRHFYNPAQEFPERWLEILALAIKETNGYCGSKENVGVNDNPIGTWCAIADKRAYHPSHDSRIVLSIGLRVLLGPDTHGVYPSSPIMLELSVHMRYLLGNEFTIQSKKKLNKSKTNLGDKKCSPRSSIRGYKGSYIENKRTIGSHGWIYE